MAKYYSINKFENKFGVNPEKTDYNTVEDYKHEFEKAGDSLDRQYLGFVEKAEEAIIEAEKLLKNIFDGDPVQLERDLDTVLQWYNYIEQHYLDANAFLTLYEVLYFVPKGGKNTEDDRKQLRKLKTIRQTYLADKLKSLLNKMSMKISIGQSQIKRYSNYFKDFQNKSNNF